MTHNEIYTTIKYLIAEFKESLKNIITNQDVTVYDKIENYVQTLSLLIKYISSKHNDIENLLNDHFDTIISNKKNSTKLEIPITENKEYLKMKLD